MYISYDKEADAVAIWFKDIASAKTIDIAEDIFVDLDERGRLAGIEILHASKKTNLMDLTKITIELPDKLRIDVNLHELVEL